MHVAVAPGGHQPEGRGSTSSRSCWLSAWFVIALLTLIVAGFLGLDGWAYAASLRHTNTPDPLDRDFYRLTKPVWFVCRLPGHPIGAGLVYFIVLGLHRDGWRVANRGLLAVLTAILSSWFVKMLVGRMRPNQAGSPLDFLPPGAGFEPGAAISFPSGEATTAFALAAALACIYPRGSLAFFAAAGLTALARLVQGSHYVSDVAAGALVGSLLAAWIYGRLGQARQP
jgi:membrane-associated phospholipid phosphatase